MTFPDHDRTYVVPPQQLASGGPVHGGFTVIENASEALVPGTTQLGLHLLSEHRLGNAHLLTPEEQRDIHAHEHAGPGTIRNHPLAERNWSLTKVRETLSEMSRTAGDAAPTCPTHGPHPHVGHGAVPASFCPDCSICRPERSSGSTNARFAELAVDGDMMMLRTTGCNCPAADASVAVPHARLCGFEPVATVTELDQVVPSLPTRLAREFHERLGLPIGDLSHEVNAFRAKLIAEEAGEAGEAIRLLNRMLAAVDRAAVPSQLAGALITDAREALAKELADVVVAVYGTAVTAGIDLDEAVRRVHASNLSKVGDDGKPIVDADGKVQKAFAEEGS